MLILATVGVLAGNETQCATSEFSTSGFLCLKASEVTVKSDYYTECAAEQSSTSYTLTSPPPKTDIVSHFLNYSIGNSAYYESLRPGSSSQFLVGNNSDSNYCTCYIYYADTIFEVTIDAKYSRKSKGIFFEEETTVELQMTRCSN
jgi:hypothetical protein